MSITTIAGVAYIAWSLWLIATGIPLLAEAAERQEPCGRG
jgi:hypothetical protein